MNLSPRAKRLATLFVDKGLLPVIWVALTVFLLYPVWHSRLLPMLDTPNHLALARGWHEYADSSWRISEHYDLRVRMVPYWLFYWSIHMMLYVTDNIEICNKVFLSAYLVLFPLSVLALAKAMHRSAWIGLFAFPFAFNQNWIYGFASYLMSVTFSLFSMAALLMYVETKKIKYAIALTCLTVLCYLSHIMPWFLFGLCAIPVLVVNWRKWQAVLVASAVMMPSVAMAVSAIIDEQHDRTYIKDAPFSATFHDFHTMIWSFSKRVMELFPGRYDYSVLTTLGVVLGLMYVWPLLRPQAKVVADDKLRTIWKCALWILGLMYVSLPYSISKPISWWYVAPRLPSLIMIYVVVGAPLELSGWRKLIMIPVIGCAIALPLKLATLYRSFSNRNLAFMRLIDDTPRGATTLVIVRNMMRGTGSEEKSGDPATSGPVYWHFSSWPMALHGGYSPFLFDQGIPLRFKRKLTTPGWGAPDSFNFRMAPEYEYYIVRDAPEEMDREPSVKLERRIGDWSLYHRIHAITDEP